MATTWPRASLAAISSWATSQRRRLDLPLVGHVLALEQDAGRLVEAVPEELEPVLDRDRIAREPGQGRSLAVAQVIADERARAQVSEDDEREQAAKPSR